MEMMLLIWQITWLVESNKKLCQEMPISKMRAQECTYTCCSRSGYDFYMYFSPGCHFTIYSLIFASFFTIASWFRLLFPFSLPSPQYAQINYEHFFISFWCLIPPSSDGNQSWLFWFTRTARKLSSLETEGGGSQNRFGLLIISGLKF